MRILILPILAFVSLAALPAAAQMPGGGIDTLGGMSGAASNPGGMAPTAGAGNRSAPPAPPAVPGAKARPDTVIPLKGGTNDLPPTEALIDAINRGDILTARDAINRGADLDSTNLLGLTPIELSVDLGRNDISFLLLSLRGAPGSVQASKQPGGAPQQTPPPMTLAERRAAARAARASAVASTKMTGTTREAVVPVRAPTLFAGNGGAPVPSAGFLGFDRH